MVRLVFRPYTQVRKAICTSAHLRASTRVSSGFTLLRHSSPSFGSQQTCSHSNLSQKIMVGRWCRPCGHPTGQVTCASWVCRPPARMHVILLGPCFKTGSLEAFRQRREGAAPEGPGRPHIPQPVGRRQGRINRPVYPAQLAHADQRPAPTAGRMTGIGLGAPAASKPFPLNNFKHFSLSFQSSFHLSLAVLVRYRSPASI